MRSGDSGAYTGHHLALKPHLLPEHLGLNYGDLIGRRSPQLRHGHHRLGLPLLSDSGQVQIQRGSLVLDGGELGELGGMRLPGQDGG